MTLIRASATVSLTLLWAGIAAGQDTRPPQPPGPYDRPVSFKQLVPNILSDQKQIWTFPVKLAEGHDLAPTAGILAGTAGLVALDPVESGYFRRSATLQGFNSVFTANATAAGILLAPASLYVIGSFRKDSKMTHTALLAGEALADTELVGTVLKDVTLRRRPADIPANRNFSDTWFEGRGNGSYINGGSFPSGHVIAAVSVATVIARRYGNHRWVPWVAYGLAGVVAFSRVSLSAHYLSDILVGGALGYSITRFSVLRQ